MFIGEHCKNALNTLPEGAVVYLIGFDANLDGFEQANCQERLQSTARENADWFVNYCEARRSFFDEGTQRL